ECTKPLASVIDGFACFQRWKPGFLTRTIVHGVYIEGKNLVVAGSFYFLVEALAGFVAKPAAASHLFDERWDLVTFAGLIIWRGFIDILDDVDKDVETDDVCGSESCGLGPPDGWAGAGIHFFDGHTQVAHEAQRVKHGKCSDAIGDEIGCVLGDDHAFPEPAVAKIVQSFDNVQGGF